MHRRKFVSLEWLPSVWRFRHLKKIPQLQRTKRVTSSAIILSICQIGPGVGLKTEGVLIDPLHCPSFSQTCFEKFAPKVRRLVHAHHNTTLNISAPKHLISNQRSSESLLLCYLFTCVMGSHSNSTCQSNMEASNNLLPVKLSFCELHFIP